MTPVAAPLVTTAATAAPALEPVAAQFNPSDLERLRALLQATAAQTANPNGLAVDPAQAAQWAERIQGASFGDSILQGLLRFGEGYQSSMKAIDVRLQEVANADPSKLTNFADIMALQIDVSKWSMSVMGVDNAAKAGSNTIKELSRGG